MMNPVPRPGTLLLCALVAAALGSCRRPDVASELDVSGADAEASPSALLDRAEDRRAYSEEIVTAGRASRSRSAG